MHNLIIEVNGRLGNHLHQILAGASIAKDNNLNLFINSTNKHWCYEDYFETFIPTIDINKIKYHHIGIPAVEFFPLDLSHEYTYLTSYFLNRNWHIHNRDYLVNWLKFKKKYVNQASEIMQGLGNNVCSIHVRRDDYLSLDYYKPTAKEYYRKLLEQLKEENYTYFVCSDDIPWCKSFFVGDNFKFSNNNFILDFLVMSKCQCNIIANSSFSYCAAYFNQAPNKKVFYPCKWSLYFGANFDQIDNLCPLDWNKVIY